MHIRITTTFYALTLSLAGLAARGADSMPGMAGMDPDAHAAHRPPASQARISAVQVTVPALTLVRQDGKSVRLPQEMDDGRPVLLNFVFTTCESVCPLMSMVFSQFQRKLGPDAANVHLMSISIDPEQDTPARLTQYARSFHAGASWNHYTGTLEASVAAQRAFGVYRGDKMSHTPVTLMRAAPGKPWVRVDGLMTPDELLGEYRKLVAAR
jgi:protein SCO1/2